MPLLQHTSQARISSTRMALVFSFITVFVFFHVIIVDGLDLCRDKEPGCAEYHVTCENPGIPHNCMKTCGACRDTPHGPECTDGHVEVSNECRPCSEQSWGVIMTNRECLQPCPPGLWGATCTQDCSSNCFLRRCERWSGQCIGGCEDGLYGSHCQLHCENCGFHGRCNPDGKCIHGCQDGWTGPRCNQRM